MIDAKVDLNAERIDVQFRGTVPDVCAELGCLIGDVYCRLLDESPVAAAFMRKLMGELVNDESPVWLPDNELGDAKEEGKENDRGIY